MKIEDDSHETSNECLSPTHNFGSRWQEDVNYPPNTQRDFLQKILSRVDASLKISILRLLLPLTKLIITAIVLAKNNGGCDKELDVWFGLLISSDAIAVVLKALVVKNLVDLDRVQRSGSLGDLLHMDGNIRAQDMLSSLTVIDTTKSGRYKKKKRTQRIIKLIWWLKVVYYFCLVLYGNLLYSRIPEPCMAEEPVRITLALIHLIIGYVYVGMPVAVVLLTFVWFTGRNLRSMRIMSKVFKKKKVFQIEMDKLKVERFAGTIEGYPECSVCEREYKAGEEILRLNCDSTHHFHKNCVRQELRKTNCCPLCGVEVTVEKSETVETMNESYTNEKVVL